MTRSEILQISKPILFNTEMVRAILDGRKTVTRRVIKPQPDKEMPDNHNLCRMPLLVNDEIKNLWYMDVIEQYPFRRTRYFEQFEPYSPGDYLYVRETWNGLPASGIFPAEFWYKADEKMLNPDEKWRPSIHMPKEAARIFLRVTDVRVEQVQDITEEEAKHEGANYRNGKNVGWEEKMRRTAVERFAEIWDSTVPPKDRDKYGWAANPWVWVIEFEKVEVQG